MLLEEFDVKKYERSIREEGREEGIEIGREEGREEGIEIGREEGREEGIEIGLEKGRKEGIEVGREAGREEESARYSKLISILLEQHREHDLRRTAEDPEYREQLYQEFGLLKKRD